MNNYKIINSNNKEVQVYKFRIGNNKSLIRKGVLLIAFIFVSIVNAQATDQFPDLLIIKNDTFFLKTFPLENLRNEKGINKRPFNYDGYGYPHTGCYRGYIATWKVIDNKLFLLKVKKADGGKDTLDLLGYFKSIDYTPTLINGFVQANWYSDTLVNYDCDSERFYLIDKHYGLSVEQFYFSNNYHIFLAKDIQLIFKKGELIENRIQSIDSYKKGDILWKEIKYYRQWFLDLGVTKVEAEVLENYGKMVRVEIKDYGTKKKRLIKKIKREMKVIEGKEYWIDPRFWNRIINK